MGATAFPRHIRRLSVLLACSVVGAAAFVLPAGAAPGGNGGGNGGGGSAAAGGGGSSSSSLNLDQCRNGTVAVPNDCDAGGWDNGNLNPQQAHYSEGQSAPYRLVMEDLPLGESITVTLEYDIKRGGKHAIDFLTHYDRLPDIDVDPTDGVTGVTGTTDTFAIQAPGSTGSPVAGQPTAAFNALPAGERAMTLFGGDITGMLYVSEGNLASTGSAATQVSVTFVADSATAVLAWGGHIASPEYWGDGNSASGVSGSPYHMSVVDWTLGNVGNQDRSMQADVVLPSEPEAPAQLTVTKTVTNDDAGTGVVGDFQLFVDQTQVTSGAVNALAAGAYTVSEGPHAGYASSIGGDCAADGTITLTPGQVARCTITNDDEDVILPPPPVPALLTVTKVVVNDNGGTGEVADFDLFVGGDEVTSGAVNSLVAGSYTVSEGPHAGYVSTIGGDCAADGTVTLVAGQTYSCTITNDDDGHDDPGPGPDPVDPGTNPVSNPATNPTTDATVESATNNNPAQPVQTAPESVLATTGSPAAPSSPTAPTLATELPRTGAGIREQSLLALALLAGGLLSLALGRRRTRPSGV